MRKLRITLFFIFAALSMAWAQGVVFEIFQNNTQLTGNPATATVMYGDDNVFSVRMAGGAEKNYEWTWCLASTPVACFSQETSYMPIIPENPASNYNLNITITRDDGVTRQLNLTIAQRPSYTVTFNANGGTPVPAVQTVLKDDKATEPTTKPSRTGYKFDYWHITGNPNTAFNFNTPITQNITLVAHWTPIKYKITWKFDNGSPDRNDSVAYDTMPAAPPNPTKPSTPQYNYAFAGWSPAIAPVTKDQIYTATYNQSLRTYTVNWEVNSTITQTNNVNYGTTVSYTGSGPAKPSTAQYDYAFTGWSPSPTVPITGNTKYVAQFSETLRSYTITWNVDGTTTTSNVSYGTTPSYSGTPAKPSTLQYTYTFTGWSPTVSSVSGPATYTAQFSPADREYNVTLNPQGGTVSPSTVKAKYNQPIASLLTPIRAGYAFNGWFTAQSGGTQYTASAPNYSDTTIKTLYAQWSIINYTITYNYKDGTPIPPLTPTSYNIESGTISLPSMQERCGWVFDGWLDNPNLSGVPSLSFTPNANNVGNKIFYEKWTPGLMTPNINLLDYNIPNQIYSGQAIAPTTITVSPKAENKCALGAITLLYNGTGTLPKDAGTYAISASIAENESYKAAIIPLGSLTIGKANITIDIESATAKNKVYDATTTAEITSISFSFVSALLGSDKVSASDYSISANFAQANVGTSIPVTGTLTWLANGPLYKNYNISPPTLSFTSSADITQAAGTLKIEQPDYELSNQKSYTISKSPFVQPSDIHIEYRKDEGAYSTHLPNRIGTYTIKAWFDPTENYTGAIDSATFTVTRGNATTVIHDKILETGFTYDPALSAKLRYYYVAGTELCNIKSTKVQITVIEPDIIFRMLSLDSIRLDSIDRGEQGDDGFMYYEITLNFGKPGVDTLFYDLLSRDGIYRESDTLLIETPIPFDSIAGQKWNNTLFINNNPKTNGGYEFSDFKWFENGIQISEMQSYSAGPSSADLLNPEDIYKVTMHTTNGMRISTCEGHPPKPKVLSTATKSAFTKQVLGINGKTTKSNAKIYNLKGSKTENTPAGVYIIEE